MRMIYAIIFSLLATVAGAGYSAAHVIPGSPDFDFPHPEKDQRADSTDPMDEAGVKALAAHWGYHLVSAVGLRGAQDLVDFRRRALSEDRGIWTSDEMSMNLLDINWDVIYSFQPYNEKLQSYGIEGRSIRNYTDAKGKEILNDLLAVRDLRYEGPFRDPTRQLTPDELRDYRFIDYVDCVAYSPTADESRYMCSYFVNNAFYTVAGLDIEPEHLPEVEESTYAGLLREKGTTAQDVLENSDRKTLKEFVDTVASIYADLIKTRGFLGLAEIIKLQIEHQTISSPWRAGNIYLFIMTMTDQEGSVLFNALDRSLEGASLNVTDQEGNNIWQLIQETLRQEVKGEGFFEYLWDNPDDPTDDVRGPDGLPIEGQAPGTSRKIGYVKTVDVSAVGLGTLIVGSGIYPEGGGDDGCSISGPGTALGSGLLNLFLIVSVLLSAVSWKNRINCGRANRLD